MAYTYVFDVNETLLDLAALDSRFDAAFGTQGVRREWFQQMLQSAFISTITGAYTDFGALGAAALSAVAQRHGATLSDEARQGILMGMRELPPHPDVRPALERMRAAGIRLATLTNSTQEVAEAQLQHAGIRELFEQALSADTVRRLKPAREAYDYAVRRLNVTPSDLALVAAHGWDVAGAAAAGVHTVFVARPGQAPDPAAAAPERVVRDLNELADQILAQA